MTQLLLGFQRRTSTVRGHELLEHQMRDWAHTEGWVLGMVFTETPDVDAFAALRRELDNGAAKGVITPSIAHLGTDAAARLTLLNGAGVGIYYLAPPP